METGSDQFLSNDFLKKLVANPNFIRNVKALDTIDPESATVARTYVRSGLNVELGKQTTNLSSIDNLLEGKGVVWNGSAYVMTPEAAQGGRVIPGMGGFGGVPMSALQENAETIRQAMDRRASIQTIGSALTALEVPVEGGAGGGSSGTVVGSTTSQLLDKFEGGGDYNALLGFSNRAGGPFAGTNVSEMTIGQLKSFADSDYADYSRKQLGYKATPMGRFQFVGSTLASVAERMGLPDDTVFTPEVQNDMFIFHAKEVMAGKSEAGKRAALKSTWEGLRKASDAELNQMIAEIEGGTATFNISGSAGGSFRAGRPSDANTVAAQAGPAVQRAVAAAGAPSAMAATTPAAPTEAAAMEAVAALPEAIPTLPANEGGTAQQQQQQQTTAVDPEVQAAIQELSSTPDKTYASDAEFLAAQEAGELEPGDSVVVDGSLYIIRKDGTAKRIGNVNQ
jgi:hypothetical protein